jgi:hypothetical protein
VQLPPGHCVAHVVAVQSCVQPPGAAHVIEQDDEPLHVWLHAPEHDSAHVDASPQVYLHAPPSGQLSAHVVPAAQSQAHGAPEVGPQTKPWPLPYVEAASCGAASNVVGASLDVLTSSGVLASLAATED